MYMAAFFLTELPSPHLIDRYISLIRKFLCQDIGQAQHLPGIVTYLKLGSYIVPPFSFTPLLALPSGDLVSLALWYPRLPSLGRSLWPLSSKLPRAK